MTDKEIIRKEIERRKKAIVDACGGCIVSQSNSIEYKVLCELAELIDFINSMKEEAVCTGIGKPKEESGVLGEMIKEIKEESSSELPTLNYKGSIDNLDNAIAEEGNVYSIEGHLFAFLKGKWRKEEEYWFPFTNQRSVRFDVED